MNSYSPLTVIKSIAARLCMLIACLSFGVKAQAQDIVPIELDTEYSTTTNTNYSFTAPKSGLLTIMFSGQQPVVYSDAAFTTPTEFNFLGYVNGKMQIAGNVEEGKTYYISVSPFFDPVVFTLSFQDANAAIEIESVTPEAGSKFAVSGNGLVSFRFNKSISFTSAKLECATASKEIDCNIQNGLYVFDIKKELFAWLESGVLTEGATFMIVMEGVCDANNSSIVYGDNGTVTVAYTAPAMPLLLVSESVPEKFLSYWHSDANDGVITLTFSGDVATGTEALIGWGNIEAENEYYQENVPVVTNGNTITVDFRGKLRNKETMLPNSMYSYGTIRISINGVKDTNGAPCYTDGQGVVGSYTYIRPYEDITSNCIAEFTPAGETSLVGKSSVELWISNASSIYSYDGVKIEYSVNGAAKSIVIAKADLDINVEDGELIINIPISEEIQNADNVTISLANVKFADGMTREFKASYNIKAVDENIYTPDGVIINPIGLGDHTTPEGLYKKSYYYFDATADGTLTITAQSDAPSVYTDQTFTTEDNSFEFSYNTGGQQVVGNVVKGKRYFIHAYPYKPITFNLSFISGDAKPEIQYLQPAAGKAFAVTGDGLIAIRFNKNILFDGAKIVCGSKEVSLDNTVQNSTYVFNIKSTLYEWMETGIAIPGETFQFIMSNVRDASNESCVYGEDGTLIVTYEVCQKPILLVSEEIPSLFRSYWPTDSYDGVLKLTFSGEVSSASGTIGWGDREKENEYYYEVVPATCEGNVVTIDYRGKLRNKATMLPQGQQSYSSIRLDVISVKDSQGNPCYITGQGVIGSFTYNIGYKDITGNLVYEFTPADGSSISKKDNVELWINDASLIHKYAGVLVTYSDKNGNSNEVLYTKDQLNVSTVEGALVINIAISKEINNAKNVTISLSEVEFSDGINREISVSYENDTATGISSIISSDNGKVNITAIDGRVIAKDVDASRLNSLPAGLYIVNGTKVYVK